MIEDNQELTAQVQEFPVYIDGAEKLAALFRPIQRYVLRPQPEADADAEEERGEALRAVREFKALIPRLTVERAAPTGTATHPTAAAPEDPWQHRSALMRCSSCMWYVRKTPGGTGRSGVGRCRRRAPTMGGYPVVTDLDWCGDHKVDELRR